jgi:glycosyltransferase involved in cell wall biosynthesis
MRIGWLADPPDRFTGGAERSAATYAQHAPAWAEVVECHPFKVWPDVDAYIIHNCTAYTADIISLLSQKPVIKRVYDLWQWGDVSLRQWILNNARLVLLSSPLQAESNGWTPAVPVEYVPSPIDTAPFRKAAQSADRQGTVWIGRLEQGKGLFAAARWADENGEAVDVYGFGPRAAELRPPLHYKGEYAYDALPGILARYKRFLFLPSAVEPYSRTTIEAWAAGLELVVNGNVGALWWMENDPAAVHHADRRFWKAVRNALK